MRTLTRSRHRFPTLITDARGMNDFRRLQGVDLTLWVRLVLFTLIVAGAGTGLVVNVL